MAVITIHIAVFTKTRYKNSARQVVFDSLPFQPGNNGINEVNLLFHQSVN